MRTMGRHEQREQVFRLLFQVEFHRPEEMPRQMRLFVEDNEVVDSQKAADEIESRCQSIREKIPEIIGDISRHGTDAVHLGSRKGCNHRHYIIGNLHHADTFPGIQYRSCHLPSGAGQSKGGY